MNARAATQGRQQSAVAQHMSQVFNYMAAGVGVSGLVAWLTISTPALMAIAQGASLIFLLIWMGAGFFLQPIVFRLQPAAALGVFAGFSALTGFAFGPFVALYTGASVATAFFTATFMFGGAALYGYATNKSLSGWGNFLMMGMWGLIGAVVVNLLVSLFTGAPIAGLSFAISLIAVPLFAGVTAWETNQLKETFNQYAGDEVLRSRIAIMSAASLYMNFIVIFIHLLQLIGERR